MSDEKTIAPRSWKDMKEPMSLEDYAAQRMREQAEQPADLSPLGEFPWETVYAEFDPSREQDERYRNRSYVYGAPDIARINGHMDEIAVKPGARYETLFFFAPDAGGNLTLQPPANLKTFQTRDRFGRVIADQAQGDVPAGAVLGVHGHIPGQNLFADNLQKSPYGDTETLSLSRPFPMATVARPREGIYKDQNVIGVHEMVNGRLQFRAPLGALSDDDRKRIQANLDRSQQKFYK